MPARASRGPALTRLEVVFKARDTHQIPPSDLEGLLDCFLKRLKLGLTNGHGCSVENGEEDIGITVTGDAEQALVATIAFLRAKKAGRNTEVRMPARGLVLKARCKLEPQREAAVRAALDRLQQSTRFIDLHFVEGDHAGPYPDEDAFELLTQAISGELGGSIWFEKWFRRTREKLVGIRVGTDADPIRAVPFLILFLREWGTGSQTLVKLCDSGQTFRVTDECIPGGDERE